MAAETERMASFGIIPSDDELSAQRRISVIIVGQIRAERGCKGPKTDGHCPFSASIWSTPLTTDPNIPLLRRPIDDGQDDRYI
jgi:hypothetical protein